MRLAIALVCVSLVLPAFSQQQDPNDSGRRFSRRGSNEQPNRPGSTPASGDSRYGQHGDRGRRAAITPAAGAATAARTPIQGRVYTGNAPAGTQPRTGPAASATSFTGPAAPASGGATGPSAPSLINGKFSPDTKIRIAATQHSAAPGETVTVTATAQAGDTAQKITAGVVLAYDGTILKMENVTAGAGVDIIDQKDRESTPERRVVRVRFGTQSPATAAPISIEFRALAHGETTLEPLSLEAVNAPGKTFLSLNDSVVAPDVNTLSVSVK